MVTGWILQDNLEPFLTTLGWIVGSSLDDDDWQAITTDLLDGGGGEYEFPGNRRMKLGISVDNNNTTLLQIAVDVPAELVSQVELAVSIFRHFQLRNPRR